MCLLDAWRDAQQVPGFDLWGTLAWGIAAVALLALGVFLAARWYHWLWAKRIVDKLGKWRW